MSFKLSYRVLSRLYSLTDVLFFPRKTHSPRHAILNWIPAGKVRVLDLCAGTALNGILIAQQRREASVVAVDRSPEMLSAARRNAARAGTPNLELQTMDASDLRLENEAFDIVILSLVLHETGRTLGRRILGEACRVLKPGGRIIVVEWRRPEGLFPRGMFKLITRLEHPGFPHFLKTDFVKYFGEAGLAIRQERNCDYTRVFELETVYSSGIADPKASGNQAENAEESGIA